MDPGPVELVRTLGVEARDPAGDSRLGRFNETLIDFFPPASSMTLVVKIPGLDLMML